MNTSMYRALILLALVVVSIVGLAKVFPANSSEGLITASPSASPSPSVSPSPSASATHHRKGKVKGVVVLILNGTDRAGLAGEVGDVLRHGGYDAVSVATAPQSRADTVVYYRADSLPEAQRLANKYFPDAKVQPIPAGAPSTVQVEVILGADYSGPSPNSSG
jgi:hypothetical protein